MISATKWVPRGYATEFPVKYTMDDEELERLSELAKLKIEEAKNEMEDIEDATEQDVEALEEKAKLDEEIDNDPELKEFGFDTYDDEPDSKLGLEGDGMDTDDEDDDEDDEDKEEQEGGELTLGSKHKIEGKDGEDPYISLPTQQDLEEEREELQILPTDNLILATKTEDEISHLEVYVYDPEEANLYVHHDIMLPSFPLCVEWINYNPREQGPGNFAAIGTFEPEIEIWNLDVVDGVYPEIILGERDEKDKKKKSKKTNKINAERHTDAVLSMSSNPHHVNLLCSGSADTTVKLWDLSNGKAASSFTFHNDKVSAVQWNPVEGTILLSGGYDKRAIVSDLRSEDKKVWKVDSDVESMNWKPCGTQFLVGTDSGMLYNFDVRNESKPLWTLQAHDSPLSSFDYNKYIDGAIVTSSASTREVKIWRETNKDDKFSLSMVANRDLSCGKVFSVGFNPDQACAGTLCAGGHGGELKVWDMFGTKAVREAFDIKSSNHSNDVIGQAFDDEEEDE